MRRPVAITPVGTRFGRRRSRAVLLTVGLWLGTTTGHAGEADGHAWFVDRLAQIRQIRGQLPDQQRTLEFVRRVGDIAAFTQATYGRYLERSLQDYEDFLAPEEMVHLLEIHRRQLHDAVTARLATDLHSWLAATGNAELRLIDARFDDDEGEVTLDTGPAGALTLQLRRRGNRWRIRDAILGEARLSRHYHRQVADVLDRGHSLAVLQARLQERDDVVLEDFTQSTPGRLPQGWGWRRRKDDRKAKLYRVREQAKVRYLAAQDTGASVILLKWSHWNPRQYPIMTWCWRADALPPGGDERFDHTNDSAAGIYVIYSENWLGVPRHVKFVWSTTLPEGTVGRRKRIARPYFFVLESGTDRLGEWVFEMVDVEESHRRVYGNAPKDRTLGIGLLTDANSTRSYAEAYYADIRVWSRAALEEGRIRDYCGRLRDLEADGDNDVRAREE